jgi:hypothetical protein
MQQPLPKATPDLKTNLTFREHVIRVMQGSVILLKIILGIVLKSRRFIIRPLLFSLAIVIILIAAVLWILNIANILIGSWSSLAGAFLAILGVLFAFFQWAIPLSPSLTDDQVYEIYLKQVRSTTFGKNGTVLIRTKGLKDRDIHALPLKDDLDELRDQGNDIREIIANAAIFGQRESTTTVARKVIIKDRSIEIAAFSGLQPGFYLFWPTRFSTPGSQSEEEKNQSHYAYHEVSSRQITEIDWRYTSETY